MRYNNNLKQLREAKSLSQQKLADILGVALYTYQRYEKGDRAPDVVTAIRLADILDVQVNDMYKGDKIVRVSVKVDEVINFMIDGQNCKLEIYKDGSYDILPADAHGYPDDRILTQIFEVVDYRDFDRDADYIDWVESCFVDEEFEADNGDIVVIDII